MKKLYALLVLVPFVAFAQGGPDENMMKARLDTQWNKNLYPPTKIDRPNEIRAKRVTYSGIAIQLVKTDRRLQLINPAAPREYGSGEENVVRNPATGRMAGLKFFSISF